MNYQLHYDRLIERAQMRLLEGYVERHHIIPRCIGGSDDADNMVSLTAEEHYVAHQLLAKMHPKNYKLAYAVQLMTVSSQNHIRNNKLYGWIRKRLSAPKSLEHRQKIGDAHRGVPKSTTQKEAQRRVMSGRTLSEEHRQKIARAGIGRTISAETREKKRQSALAYWAARKQTLNRRSPKASA